MPNTNTTTMDKVKFIALTIALLTLCNHLIGQSYFQKTYGSTTTDRGRQIIKLKDNNFAIIGSSTGAFQGIKLIKVDSSGNPIWQKSFFSPDILHYNYCDSFLESQDSGFIIAGNTGYTSAYGRDICLIKLNSAGDTIWTKIYAGPSLAYYRAEANEIIHTSDGGYAITGNERGSWDKDVFLIKTDSNGNVQWSKSYGGSDDDVGLSLKQTEEGGFVITGYTSSFGNGSRDVYLLKVNSNGSLLWTRTYGGIFWDFANHIEVTNDNGFVVTGCSSNNVTGFDLFIMKTDSSGNTVWANTYGGDEDEVGISVKQINDGSYIVTGYTNSYGLGQTDVYLVKTDSNGNALWSNTYGGASDDQGNDVIELTDGFVIVGTTRNFSRGSTDVYLVKVDDSGKGTCKQDTAQSIVNTLNWIQGTGGTESSGNTIKIYPILSINQDTSSYDPCECVPPVAGFGVIIMGWWDVTFEDYSTWADNWFWDFGDGETSTLQNPGHYYEMDGTFNVCLTVSNDCGTDTCCHSVHLESGIGINETGSNELEIFIAPNPFDDFTEIKFVNKKIGKLNLSLINSLGQIVMQIENITGNEIRIKRNNLTSGLYYFKLFTDIHLVATGKLVIK